MALRLITGAANTGKTGLAYAALREELDRGGRPVLLVPSQPDAERALAELSSGYPIGLRCMTFERYVRESWEQFGDGRAIVPSAERGLLSSAAARAVGASSGMAALVRRCVERLSEQTGFAWRATSGLSRGPGVALSRAVSEYASALAANGLVERAEATHWLAAHGDAPASLVVHRFTDFTTSQEALIREYARRATVVVSLTYDPGAPATSAARELIERLEPAEQVQAPSTVFETDDTLQRLSEGLFDRPHHLAPGKGVRFSLAEGYHAEAQRIAEEVRSAILEGTASSYERIAVVFRDPERHYGAVRQAFREAGIPADYDVRRPLRVVAFGSAVCHLLAFGLAGERAELLALLRSRFSGVDREQCRELERRWRSRSVSDRSRIMTDLEEVSSGLTGILSCVLGSASATLDPHQLGRIAEAVSQLFVLGYGREGNADGAQVEADAWAHSAVMNTLSRAARLERTGVTMRDVLETLKELETPAGETERPGHVQVTSVTRVRGRRFDTVILGGLNSGEFPHAPGEDMLPGSAVDEVLRCFGGSGEAGRGAEYEQYLFYSAVTKAKQRLVLSARSTDEDGEPVAISPFLEVVGDSFRDPDSETSMPPHEYRSLSQAPKGGAEAGEREDARTLALAGDRATPRLDSAARRATPRVPHLADELLLEHLAARDVFSASEIEAYLRCPYGWFHSYAVRPRELERAFGAAEEGSYAHELLRRTYAGLIDAGTPKVTAETLEVALEVLSVQSDALDRETGKPGSIAERLSREKAGRWAARIIAQDVELLRGFRPVYLEWEFGSEDGIDVGPFKLRGRVDRIDVDDAGHAVVTDYKRSVAPKAADIVSAGKVQIPLYFKAVESVLGLTPVAGLYRVLARSETRGLVLRDALEPDGLTSTDLKDAVEFEAIVDAGLELAGQAVEGMRAGRIECEPKKADSCRYCGATLFCGVGR